MQREREREKNREREREREGEREKEKGGGGKEEMNKLFHFRRYDTMKNKNVTDDDLGRASEVTNCSTGRIRVETAGN